VDHNSKKSKDDEYLLFVITPYIGNNEIAHTHSLEKIKRAVEYSLQRGKNLIKTMYKGLRPVVINGMPTGAFPCDMERFNRICKHMGNAIYFHHYNEQFDGEFLVKTNSLRMSDYSPSNIYRELGNIENIMSSGTKYGSNPDVFYYQIMEFSGIIHLRLVFYEGFSVLLIKKIPILGQGKDSNPV